MRNVPLRELINYICTSSGTTLVEQPFALMIRPSGADSPDMIVKTYRVPPDFLTSNAAPDAGGEVDDPFAAPSNEGRLASSPDGRRGSEGQGSGLP